MLNHILKAAKQVLKKKNSSEDRDYLEKIVKNVEERWNNLNEKVVKRYKQIQRIIPQANILNSEFDYFLTWLESMEKNLKSLPVLYSDYEETIQRKRSLQVFKVIQFFAKLIFEKGNENIISCLLFSGFSKRN